MPWIVGGIGVASLAASGVFYVLRNSANDDLEAGCINDVCPDTLEDTQSRGENYSMLTGVTLGIGVVGVVVSAIWLLSGSDSPPATAKARPPRDVRFDVGFTAGPRLGLSGSF